MTISIAARCGRTGQFGIAISSSSPAVAARCAHTRAGVGAACSQNITDPRLGHQLLDQLQIGRTADEAIAAVVAQEPLISYRQLTCIGVSDVGATYSGSGTLGTNNTAIGRDAVAAGNLLANPGVPAAIAAAFEAIPELDLGDRLLAALQAGLDSGGEAGPVHSAGLQIVGDVPWPITDLRVDWHDEPVAELQRIWQLWKPQAADYRQRALDPSAAPSYGVPGDPR